MLTLTMMRLKELFRQPTLLCFSPPVMIGTIIIELVLALFVALRYVIKTPQRLIIALLVFLAAFQMAEYNVCTSWPIELIWSRLGYAFITMLPPLGVHLAVSLRRERRPLLLAISYTLALMLVIGFVFLPRQLNTGVCTGNYVIFLLQQPLSAVYTVYYFGLEAVGLVLSMLFLKHQKPESRVVLRLLGVGYLAIMIPTFIVYLILPATGIGIPSVMCGFAVILAIIIGGLIAPRISRTR